jgi:hypothetical protein
MGSHSSGGPVEQRVGFRKGAEGGRGELLTGGTETAHSTEQNREKNKGKVPMGPTAAYAVRPSRAPGASVSTGPENKTLLGHSEM